MQRKINDDQGSSQPHSPGWARVTLFPQISINFSYFFSNFNYFLPHFGPPGVRVSHPGRPWLRHGCVSCPPWKALATPRMCESPTLEGPGYATDDDSINIKLNWQTCRRTARLCDSTTLRMHALYFANIIPSFFII